MAFITTTLPRYARFDALKAEFSQRRARYATYRQTRAELSALSDRELSDIGIGRSDVDRIARDAAGML